MRKTSHDGAECSSLSSIDNEHKKPGILKTTRNSIKRKVQNFSHESDDAVIEPLLEKDEVTKTNGKSAPKSIAQQLQESVERQAKQVTYAFKSSDTSEHTKLISSVTNEEPLICVTECNPNKPVEVNALKNSYIPSFTKPAITGNNDATNHRAEIHSVLPKSTHDINEQHGTETKDGKGSHPYYSPSPLIFTTAKIHEDAKVTTKNPLLVTALPIVSTSENKIKKEDDIKSTINKQPLTADLQTPLLKVDAKLVNPDVTNKSIVNISAPSMIHFDSCPSNTTASKIIAGINSHATVTSVAILNKKPQEPNSIISSNSKVLQSLPSITKSDNKFISSQSSADHKSKPETVTVNTDDKTKTSVAKDIVQVKGTNIPNKDAPKLQKTPSFEQNHAKQNKSKENIVKDKVIKEQDKKEKAKINSQSSKDSLKITTSSSIKTKGIPNLESKKSQEESSGLNISKVKTTIGATNVSNKSEKSKLVRQGKTEDKPDISTTKEKPPVVGKIEKETDKSSPIKKNDSKEKVNTSKATASTSGNIAKQLPIKTTKPSGTTTVTTQIATKAASKVDLSKNKDKKVPK